MIFSFHYTRKITCLVLLAVFFITTTFAPQPAAKTRTIITTDGEIDDSAQWCAGCNMLMILDKPFHKQRGKDSSSRLTPAVALPMVL